MRIQSQLCAAALLLGACAGEPYPAETASVTGESDAAAEITETAMAEDPLMNWGDLVGRPLPQPDMTVTTGPGETDIVDVWLPEGEGPFPTVLMIHGGCWQKEIADRTLMNYAASGLRDEGMAVWNIEYRGVDEAGGGYPGTFLDVARAVDALAERGPALGLDTSNVVATGHSAGGHLALWAAARPNIAETSPLFSETPFVPKAVVNVGGLADLQASAPVTQAGCLADIMDMLTGASSEDRADVFSDTSPAALLPLGIPQISVNGTSDRIAPPQLGQGYTAKASEAGDRAEYVEVSGGHVELVAPGTAAFDRQIEILRGLLGLDAEDAN
ncbi:alpha/beta hydrolase [Henriciella sp.]|uniref:alpha/beta hydrolase family protein n=1 Tax=Henriciella sp. TaxID=1968823 RepID=UPI0025C0B801|nr:alpha/beta hydrolase [Henriciella sp.]